MSNNAKLFSIFILYGIIGPICLFPNFVIDFSRKHVSRSNFTHRMMESQMHQPPHEQGNLNLPPLPKHIRLNPQLYNQQPFPRSHETQLNELITRKIQNFDRNTLIFKYNVFSCWPYFSNHLEPCIIVIM